MEANLKTVLSAIYELEGLLTVIENRKIGNPGLANNLIVEKAHLIARLVDELYAEDSAKTTSDVYDNSQHEVCDEIEENVHKSSDDIDSVIRLLEESQTTPVDMSEVSENLPDEVTESDNDLEPDNDEEVDDNYELDDELPESDDESFYDEDTIEDDYFNDDVVTDLRINDQLGINMSKNLKQAFTLNDRFRFRRELFGNRDVEFNETLNLVEAMHSFDEAEDYFYNDLQWDRESPEVVDFMKIVEKHFS